MTEGSIWAVLGIAATRDVGDIRRAYAARLKVTHPEDDAEGFRQLREAYETALAMARSRAFAPAAADGDDDAWSDEDEDHEEASRPDDDWDTGWKAPPAAAPRAPEPADEARAESSSQVDYDNLWRRLESLVFGPDAADSKALTAALEAILFHPRLEELGAYMAAEQRVAALIARGAPRTDPLIAPARARFDWLALAEQRTASPDVLQAMWRERQARQEAAIAALEAVLRQDSSTENDLDRALTEVTRGVMQDEAVYRFTESELCRLVLDCAPRLDPFIGAIAGALAWDRQYFDERAPQIIARREDALARQRLRSPAHRLHRAWLALQKPPGPAEALLQMLQPRRHGRIRQLLGALRTQHPALLNDIPAATVKAWDGYFRIARINPFALAVLAAFALVVTFAVQAERREQAALVAQYYPPAALQARVGGEVVLRCRARYDGQLGSCNLISEAPPAHGLAQAARKMALDGKLHTLSDAPQSWETFDADLRFIPAGPGQTPAIRVTVTEFRPVPGDDAADGAGRQADPGFVEVNGTVRLRCLRDDKGGLSRCQALSETPAGIGLGDLAVNYAQDGVLKAPPGPPGWVEFTAPVGEQVASGAVRIQAVPAPPVIARQIDGRVILSCVAQSSGRMSQCRVLWQSPRGAGLGERALAEAQRGQIGLARGTVSSPRRVNLNVVYGDHPPPVPPASEWAPPRDPKPGSVPLRLESREGSADMAGGDTAPVPRPHPALGTAPDGPAN
ncbi:J domain-containing protein [Caulobacter sp. KR2-114]|uniref:J domain-containing protein n=1 Tax=Caulobacter sp. KR2-114 TaxID=3400912 RepID=UPI003C12ADD8